MVGALRIGGSVSNDTMVLSMAITGDLGATWVMRPLPWPTRYHSLPFSIEPDLFGVYVWEPGFKLVIYTTDSTFVSWKRGNLVMSNMLEPASFAPTSEADAFLGGTFDAPRPSSSRPDGTERSLDASAPYVYDYRYKP